MKIIITFLLVGLYLNSNSQSTVYSSDDRPTIKKRHKVKKHVDSEPRTPSYVDKSYSIYDDPLVSQTAAENDAANARLDKYAHTGKDSFQGIAIGDDPEAYNDALADGIQLSGNNAEIAQKIQEYKTTRLLKRAGYITAIAAFIILLLFYIKRKMNKIPLS